MFALKKDFYHDFKLGKHSGHLDAESDEDGYLYTLYVDDIAYADLVHIEKGDLEDYLTVKMGFYS